MKFERIKDNKKILLITVIVFVVILTLIITTSLAKYELTQSINIAKGTINYSPSDLNIMGIYIESDSGYTETDTIPESGYTLNEDESYCKIGDTEQDVTISYDMSTQALSITPMTSKGLKCYLYFDVSICPSGATACETIMANKTISERTDFSTVLTTDTTGTVYSAADDDGTSYYYAGAPTDNWITFAGYYWRIIRINGDGTIRLIYSGNVSIIDALENRNEVLANGYNDYDTKYTIIGSDYFNTYSTADNMYVGYMYTSGLVHGFDESSTIKGLVDDWYVDNLTSQEKYIDVDAGFCGDRTPSTSSSSSNGSGGTGATETYYGAYIRLKTNNNPTFKCTDNGDLYTVNNSSKGNKALTYPIGLITADEIVYAGGIFNSTGNTSYYLYCYNMYWTMTPYRASTNGVPWVFHMNYEGTFGASSVKNSVPGARPVINLRADVTLTGNGTSTDPYVAS